MTLHREGGYIEFVITGSVDHGHRLKYAISTAFAKGIVRVQQTRAFGISAESKEKRTKQTRNQANRKITMQR